MNTSTFFIVATLAFFTAIIVVIVGVWIIWRHYKAPDMVATEVPIPTRYQLLPLIEKRNMQPKTMLFLENIGDGEVAEVSVRGSHCAATMIYFSETQQFFTSYVNQRMLNSGNVVIVVFNTHARNDESLPSDACVNVHYLRKPSQLHRCGMKSFALSELFIPERPQTKQVLRENRRFRKKLSKTMHRKYHKTTTYQMESSCSFNTFELWFEQYLGGISRHI